MGMDLLEEIRKAKRGEPSCVELAPMSPEELSIEKKIHDKGYRFAFGNGMTRAQMAEMLPDWRNEKPAEAAEIDFSI